MSAVERFFAKGIVFVKIKKDITEFLKEKKLIFIGATNNEMKFGNVAYYELKKRGYQLYPVNPNQEFIGIDPCYRNVSEIDGKSDRVFFCTPSQVTEAIIAVLHQERISKVWMQPGAGSKKAVTLCENKGIGVIYGHCLLMHAKPVRSYHLAHRCSRIMTGRLYQRNGF